MFGCLCVCLIWVVVFVVEGWVVFFEVFGYGVIEFVIGWFYGGIFVKVGCCFNFYMFFGNFIDKVRW